MHRFDTRHLGSGVRGIWDGGVMSWRASDLAEDDVRQQAADRNVTFNQYGQRDQSRSQRSQPADRGGVSHLVCRRRSRLPGERAPGVVSRVRLQTDITCGSELLIYVRHEEHR